MGASGAHALIWAAGDGDGGEAGRRHSSVSENGLSKQAEVRREWDLGAQGEAGLSHLGSGPRPHGTCTCPALQTHPPGPAGEWQVTSSPCSQDLS